MKQKIEVGETLGEAFRLYREQAGVLLPVAFWLFLAVAIVEELTFAALGLYVLASVLSLAVITLYQGMVVRLVSDVRDGRRDSGVGDLIRSVVPVLWPLIGAGILSAFGVAGGFLLLVVPGLYLLTIWAVIAPVIVVERRRVFDAFGRSRQLVRGNGWPVLWTVLVSFLIAMVVTAAFLAIIASLSDEVLLRIVVGALGSMITAPVAALVASVLYFRLLEIEEARSPAEDSVPQQPGDGLG
ncbi:MAG TPA: hypothetical protein VD761_02955 [Solirubrobacterales bacterium]|nr:hypothetical protein [Solirubrobacterales bacterium]